MEVTDFSAILLFIFLTTRH